MSSKQMVVAFGAGAVCMGTLAFVIAAGPEHGDHAKDALKKGADKHMQRGTEMVNDAMGHQPETSPEMSPEAMAEMEGWMKLGIPNEHHEMLAKGVGEWNATTWFKMDPNAPAMEGTGTMSTKALFDGRYFASQFHMDDMMGMPFDGRAFIGYDNGREQFVSTWIDSMSTAIFVSKGAMSSDSTKLVMMGTHIGPTGEDQTMKMVTEWTGDNSFTDTMYDLVDGEWNLHGKISYTRKGHANASD